MLNAIVQQLDAIPASFWGVVIGSFFSILGVALTNRASEKRLNAQLAHERASSTKNREMELRKEVFLSAAEAVAAGMTSISRFVDLEIPNAQVTELYVEKSPAISKVHVIAGTETVLSLARFTSRLEALYLELFTKRYELMSEKNAVAILDSHISQFGKERDQILEQLKRYNVEGSIDQRRWSVLQKDFEFEQKRIDEFIGRRNALIAELTPRHLEFMRECLVHTAKLGEMVVPTLIAVRQELELPLDEAAYRAVMVDSYAQQEQAIDTFIRTHLPNTVQSIGEEHTAR